MIVVVGTTCDSSLERWKSLELRAGASSLLQALNRPFSGIVKVACPV